MDEVATMFSFNNWFDHFSYLLIAISYWLTDIFWLRLVAVVGLSFEILYFWHSGGDLRTGIGWDLIFIIINAYQLYRLLRDRLSPRLPEADRDLLRSVFIGLDDAQIARLLAAGAFCDLADGTTLAVEDEPLEKIYFICAGRVGVTIAGREVSHLEAISSERSRSDGDRRRQRPGARLRRGQAQSVLPQRNGSRGPDLSAPGARACTKDQGQQSADLACKQSGLGLGLAALPANTEVFRVLWAENRMALRNRDAVAKLAHGVRPQAFPSGGHAPLEALVAPRPGAPPDEVGRVHSAKFIVHHVLADPTLSFSA